jgi:hypothetical protein
VYLLYAIVGVAIALAFGVSETMVRKPVPAPAS